MTSTTKCPQCGATATGNFCASCGAAVGARACPTCGAEPEPGSHFCTQCGSPLAAGTPSPMPQAQAQPTRVAGGGGGGEQNMAWWIAGGMLVLLILVVAWPILRPDQVAPPAGGPGGADPAAGMSSVDLTTMTPREAADRLFNRVMGAAENGDTLTVQSFLPMSISAYEQAKPLNPDGMYHLSILQRLGGDAAGALATAEEVLADNPDHLLNLAAAAQAAQELGDDAKVRQYYQHMLDVWETQMASGNDDYVQHASIMDTLHGEAQTYLAGG